MAIQVVIVAATAGFVGYFLHRGRRRYARSVLRLLSTAVVAMALLGAALSFVLTAPWANASTGSWYAYATATTSGLATCPQTTDTTQQCTLTEALSLVTPGGTVYLATTAAAGDYDGNWALATSGTSPSAPVSIEAAPGVTNPTLDGNLGNATGCQTSSCDGAVLSVGTGLYVELQGVTLYLADNTTGSEYGGAIDNSGTLTVTGCYFSADVAGFSGGAIYNTGTLTVATSTFLGNGATSYDGGAIYNVGGSVTISGSAFAGNAANEEGGAIYNTVMGSVTVSGTTFSGNTATDAGGAIYTAGGSVTVSDSTFPANVATSGLGGAIYNDDGTLTAWASTFSVYASPDTGNLIYGGASSWMVADIFDGSCNLGGALHDEGYNVASDATCLAGGPGDADYAQSLINVLGTPTNNGGPNQSTYFATMLPLTGDPAIGLIPNTTQVSLGGSEVTLCPTTDQRGDPSTTGEPCDAGAVQVPSTTSSSTTSSTTTSSSTTSSTTTSSTTSSTTTTTSSSPGSGGGGFAPAPPKKTATTITLSASPDPATTGQRVTYTATVSPAPDGGALVFTEDSQVIANCGMVSLFAATGQATCSTTYSSPGTRQVVATYSGDTNFIGTVSAVYAEMVQGSTTTTTITAAPTPVVTALTARASIAKEAVKLGLRCAMSACQGTIMLWHNGVLFGRGSYSLAVGRTASFSVQLSTKAMKVCTRQHSVMVSETVNVLRGRSAKASVKLVA